MKDKPPHDSIVRTADLIRKLLSVPKRELDSRERNWKSRKRRTHKLERRTT